MATYTRSVHPISQFLRWTEQSQLVLQPKFQRRAAWPPAARSYLIDTLVRGLPIPKIYLRKVLNPKTKLMAYEVVDGQQRLRAILDFCAGDLVLSRRHNADLGDATFTNLPDPVRRELLSYEISTEVMERASDPEVWAMFERLNSYTLTLNRQEKLNAKWFGYFKQTAYTLAAEESALAAWRQLKVFGDRQIARMVEVELTSDVLVATLEGISDITKISAAYEKYDAKFEERYDKTKQFRTMLSWLAEELSGTVKITKFRSRTWFYSIAVATIDALFGIPGGHGPRRFRPSTEIMSRMIKLDNALKPSGLLDLPPGLTRLHQAFSRGTSHVPERTVRHDFFFCMLTAPPQKWEEKCQEIFPS